MSLSGVESNVWCMQFSPPIGKGKLHGRYVKPNFTLKQVSMMGARGLIEGVTGTFESSVTNYQPITDYHKGVEVHPKYSLKHSGSQSSFINIELCPAWTGLYQRPLHLKPNGRVTLKVSGRAMAPSSFIPSSTTHPYFVGWLSKQTNINSHKSYSNTYKPKSTEVSRYQVVCISYILKAIQHTSL